MQTCYTIYYPNGAKKGEVEWPEKPGYLRIKALVEPILDGADLEHVTVLHSGQPADMFVDEMGMLKGLPVNSEATAIYRRYTLTSAPKTRPETLPEIYGTAILFDRRVWF